MRGGRGSACERKEVKKEMKTEDEKRGRGRAVEAVEMANE